MLFVTSDAPDFFDNYQDTLLQRLERLQELCTSGSLTTRDASAAVAELIQIGRNVEVDRVPWGVSREAGE